MLKCNLIQLFCVYASQQYIYYSDAYGLYLQKIQFLPHRAFIMETHTHIQYIYLLNKQLISYWTIRPF